MARVALRRMGNGKLEFLGFVDGKGRIRKAKTRRVNPKLGKYKVYTDAGFGKPKYFRRKKDAVKFARKIGRSVVRA